jgi:hypothetical protein
VSLGGLMRDNKFDVRARRQLAREVINRNND